MNIEDKLVSVFSVLFNKEIGLSDNLSMETEPAWDSMKHIEIIMTVEEEFGVSFAPEDIPSLTSFGKIKQAISKAG